MKIVFLTGMSGSGKSTIAKELCKNDKYNLICSFTDRQKRNKDDTDHTFISPNHMDLIYDSDDIVAKTQINEHRYCSIYPQFVDDKINVYISDVKGINDTIKCFPQANIMSILIVREKCEADCIRAGRDIQIPAREDVDFLINNNYKIESAVNTINALVNFDFFDKPSHTVKTINDKLKYLENQYRNLEEIKISLLKQLWYECRSQYLQMCQYVEHKINADFDFQITITPDTAPEIYDGYLQFNVIGSYKEDVDWDTSHRISDQLSLYALEYCNENEYDDIAFRLYVSEYYEEDNYE